MANHMVHSRPRVCSLYPILWHDGFDPDKFTCLMIHMHLQLKSEVEEQLYS